MNDWYPSPRLFSSGLQNTTDSLEASSWTWRSLWAIMNLPPSDTVICVCVTGINSHTQESGKSDGLAYGFNYRSGLIRSPLSRDWCILIKFKFTMDVMLESDYHSVHFACGCVLFKIRVPSLSVWLDYHLSRALNSFLTLSQKFCLLLHCCISLSLVFNKMRIVQ